MKCPRCQQDNPARAEFCLRCGAPVDGLGPSPESYADLKGEVERLRRSLGEALDQQTATSEVLKVISRSAFDLQPVFDVVVENAVRLCEADRAVIFRFDGILRAVASYNASPKLRQFLEQNPFALGRRGAAGRAALERRTVHIPDAQADPEYRARAAQVEPIRTILGVPILKGDDLLGVIVTWKREVKPFNVKQIALLETFADQAVIAIENVRLFTELQEKNQALTTAHAQVSESLEQQTATSEILRVISSSPTDVRPVFDTILERAATLCEAQLAHLWLYEGGEQFRLGAGYGSRPDHLQWLEQGLHRIGRPFFREIGPWRVGQILDVRDTEPYRRGEALWIRTADHEGMRTLLGVPLVKDGRLVGSIAIYRREVRPFTDAQVALVKTFADQAVIAIENGRLFTELQDKNRALSEAHAQVTEALEQQTATSEILRVISSSPTDAQPVFDTIVRSSDRLLGGLAGSLALRVGDEVHLVALTPTNPEGDAVLRRLYPMPIGEDGGHGEVVRLCRPLMITDTEAELTGRIREFARIRGFRSRLSVPLIRDGIAIGSLGVTRAAPGAFTDRETALLQTFADQAVIAIENVRLFKELETRNRDLTEALDRQTATAEILRIIAGSPTDVQPVFTTIVQSAQRLLAGHSAAVMLRIGDEIHLQAYTSTEGTHDAEVRSFWPLSIGTPAVARVFIDGETEQISDVESDPNLLEVTRTFARHRGWRSRVVVPMHRAETVRGAIAVTRREPGPFSEEEIAVLQTFADQAVIAIENVRLFKELEARNGALTESLEQQTATSEILRVISSSPKDVQPVFDAIIANAVQLCGGVYGIIWRYDGEVVTLVGSHHLPGESREDLIGQFPRRLDDLYGPLPNALRTGTVVDIPDVERYDDPGGRMRRLWRARGVRSVVMVPIRQESGVAGAISVSHPEVDAFSSERVELLKTFASQAVIAIENVRLFNELEAVNRHLEAASQHKSEFLANMSHELRTPLNAVIGFSEVLSEGMFGQLNDKQEEYARDIYSSGQHLLSLINDILDLSKIEAGRMELELTDFHLPTALDNALTLVRERAGRRGIALGLAVDERLGQIQADERKIRQIVLNLLSNAIKFTPEGGRIEVRAAPVDGSVEVSVTDTGVGIAPEDQEVIFEEFKQVGTAAKKVEGTGLGLALSRRFIELHGGRIWVKSEVGVGSTFTFGIPVHTGA